MAFMQTLLLEMQQSTAASSQYPFVIPGTSCIESWQCTGMLPQNHAFLAQEWRCSV